MRLAFMGTPEFAVPALRALHAAGHDIAAVYCQPPRPAGRGQAVRRCAVQVAADALGLEVRTPPTLKRDPAAQASFAALGLDAAVVAAYGLLLPEPMLAAPRRGCLNLHASLLPRWRGAAPIQAAILAGDAATGVTIMQMEAGLDTGPMLLAASLPITDTATAAVLHDELAALGADLILRALAEHPAPVPVATSSASSSTVPGAPLPSATVAARTLYGAPAKVKNVPGQGLSARTRRASAAASCVQSRRPSSRVSFAA